MSLDSDLVVSNRLPTSLPSRFSSRRARTPYRFPAHYVLTDFRRIEEGTLINTRIENNLLRLTLPAATNVTYQIQQSTNLVDWVTLTNVMGRNDLKAISTYISGEQRFYRVRRL